MPDKHNIFAYLSSRLPSLRRSWWDEVWSCLTHIYICPEPNSNPQTSPVWIILKRPETQYSSRKLMSLRNSNKLFISPLLIDDGDYSSDGDVQII